MASSIAGSPPKEGQDALDCANKGQNSYRQGNYSLTIHLFNSLQRGHLPNIHLVCLRGQIKTQGMKRREKDAMCLSPLPESSYSQCLDFVSFKCKDICTD